MKSDLLRGDCFLLELEGISTAGFSSCSGLALDREVLEYREGGFDGVRQLRGQISSGRIVLERGLTSDRELWEWFERGDARSGAIVLLDAEGREAERWMFQDAWPTRWEGPALDARSAEVALERVVIVHEGLRWQGV